MSQSQPAADGRVQVQSEPAALRIQIGQRGLANLYPWLFFGAAVLLLIFWIKIMPWGQLVGAGESVADDWSAFALLTPIVLGSLGYLLYKGILLVFERQSIVIEEGSLLLARQLFGWTRTMSVPIAEVGDLTVKRIWPTQAIRCVAVEINGKAKSFAYQVTAMQAYQVVEALSTHLSQDA